MLFNVLTLNGLDSGSKDFNLPNLESFNQFFDFLENCQPEFYEKIQDKSFKIVFLKDLNSEPIVWTSDIKILDIKNYLFCFLVEDVKGDFGTAIAALVAAIVTALGTVGIVGITATIIAYAVTLGIVIGIAYGIGQIMIALSPAQSPQSPEAYKKSLLFSDNQQVTTQGGVVSWVFGECTCFGTIIGRTISTYEWESGTDLYTPNLPAGIPLISKTALSTAPESVWQRLTT